MTTEAPTTGGKVYAAISAVQSDLAKKGIGKDKKNDQQGYMFRGIDAVYNVLSPILVANKLVILPRVLKREVVERAARSGGALFSVALEVEYDLICTEDGSKHTVKVFGEAMDSADKATNKAMSAAYKYMALMSFAIPVVGEMLDADKTDYKVKSGSEKPAPVDKVKGAELISAAQRIALAKAWRAAGKEDVDVSGYLNEKYEISTTLEIKLKDYQEIMAWASGKPLKGA